MGCKFKYPALLCVCLALAVGSSCAGKNSNIAFSLKRDRILDDVKRSTRNVKVYRELDTIFIADILWYSPQLKRNFIGSMKAEGRIDDVQAKQMLDDVTTQEGQEVEFIVGFYTPDKTQNDLDKANSMWRLTLKGADETAIVPVTIERLKYDSMKDAWMFPFLTPWKYAYRVKYALTDPLKTANSYTLRLSSVVGDGVFNWELKK
jgi:hypothetical protein